MGPEPVWGQFLNKSFEQESSKELRDHQGQCHIHLANGVQHHFAGNYDAAIATFQKAIEAVKRTGVLNAYITPNYAWLVTSLRMLYADKPPQIERNRRKAVRDIERAARRALRVAYRFRNELPHAYREMAAAEALQGRFRKALRLLDKSMYVAVQQGAQYELAQSALLQAELRYEWSDTPANKSQLNEAWEALSRIENSVRDSSLTTSLSLIDRFEVVLDAGREINAGHGSDTRSSREHWTPLNVSCAETGCLSFIDNKMQRDVDLKSCNRLEAVTTLTKSIVLRAVESKAVQIERLENVNRHGMALQQRGAFLALSNLSV